MDDIAALRAEVERLRDLCDENGIDATVGTSIRIRLPADWCTQYVPESEEPDYLAIARALNNT